MTTALLHRLGQRWQIWIAFACAITLHLAAISFARNVSDIRSFTPSTDEGIDLSIDPTPDTTPIEPEEVTSPEPPAFVKPDEIVPEESSVPAPRKSRIQKKISLLARSTSIARGSAPSFGSVKVLAIYAPRPGYPYEARRDRITGSGLVVLIVDSLTGDVTDAHMAQSTRSAILDNSAMSACRSWRFKSGTVTRVQVPITYTLYGASY